MIPNSTDTYPDGELSNLRQSASFTPVVHKKQKRRQLQQQQQLKQQTSSAQPHPSATIAGQWRQAGAGSHAYSTPGSTAGAVPTLQGYSSEGQPVVTTLHEEDSFQDGLQNIGFQSLPAAFDREMVHAAATASAQHGYYINPAQPPQLTTFTSDQSPVTHSARRQAPAKSTSGSGTICSHVSAPMEKLMSMAVAGYAPNPPPQATGPGPVQRSTTMPVNFSYGQPHFRGSVPDQLQHVTDQALQFQASLQFTSSDNGHVTGSRFDSREGGMVQGPWLGRNKLESIPSLGGAGLSFTEETLLPSLATTSMGALTSGAYQLSTPPGSPHKVQSQQPNTVQHSTHSMLLSEVQQASDSPSPSREQVKRQLQGSDQQELPWQALTLLQLPSQGSAANLNSSLASQQPSFIAASQPSVLTPTGAQNSPTHAGAYTNSPRHKQSSFITSQPFGQQPQESKPAVTVVAQNQSSIGASIGAAGHMAAAAAAATDMELQTFWEYLLGEASPAPKLPTADVVWGQTERDRVYNFLLYVPYQVERLIQFGSLLCWDSLVALFTLMPVRALAAAAQLLLGRTSNSTGQAAVGAAGSKPRTVRIAGNQVYDMLCLVIILVVTAVLRAIRPGFIYYWLKDITSEFLKMSVLSSAFEITDKILSNFGMDVMEALSGTCTLWVAGRRSTAQLAADTGVALGITLTHALTLMCQGLVLAVALNSRRQGLLALLIANNFVEIKGAVFKRWDVPRIWGLVCQDIVERLHLWGVILFVVVEDMDSAASWRPSPLILWESIRILGAEIIIDVLKHAVLGKFNDVRPGIYREYMKDLCEKAVSSQSHTLNKLMGFQHLPTACLCLRAATTLFWLKLDPSPLYYAQLWRRAWLVLAAWMCLLVTKPFFGYLLKLQAHAYVRYHAMTYPKPGSRPINVPQLGRTPPPAAASQPSQIAAATGQNASAGGSGSGGVGGGGGVGAGLGMAAGGKSGDASSSVGGSNANTPRSFMPGNLGHAGNASTNSLASYAGNSIHNSQPVSASADRGAAATGHKGRITGQLEGRDALGNTSLVDRSLIHSAGGVDSNPTSSRHVDSNSHTSSAGGSASTMVQERHRLAIADSAHASTSYGGSAVSDEGLHRRAGRAVVLEGTNVQEAVTDASNHTHVGRAGTHVQQQQPPVMRQVNEGRQNGTASAGGSGSGGGSSVGGGRGGKGKGGKGGGGKAGQHGKHA